MDAELGQRAFVQRLAHRFLARICYRGANCAGEDPSGVWTLNLNDEFSYSYWSHGFRIEFVIVALTVPMVMQAVCGLWTYTMSLRKAIGTSVLVIIRICYRGGACANGDATGIWTLDLRSESSNNGWSSGFSYN